MSYTGRDLSNQDLRYHDFTRQVLFETDLCGARLYGMQVSLACDTFDGVKLDNEQMSTLLLMIALANVDERWVKALHATVKSMIGDEAYKVICRYLKLA